MSISDWLRILVTGKPQWWAILYFSLRVFSSFCDFISFFPLFVFYCQLAACLLQHAEIFTDNISSSRKKFVKRKGRGTCTCALPLCMHVDHYLTGILTA